MKAIRHWLYNALAGGLILFAFAGCGKPWHSPKRFVVERVPLRSNERVLMEGTILKIKEIEAGKGLLKKIKTDIVKDPSWSPACGEIPCIRAITMVIHMDPALNASLGIAVIALEDLPDNPYAEGTKLDSDLVRYWNSNSTVLLDSTKQFDGRSDTGYHPLQGAQYHFLFADQKPLGLSTRSNLVFYNKVSGDIYRHYPVQTVISNDIYAAVGITGAALAFLAYGSR